MYKLIIILIVFFVVKYYINYNNVKKEKNLKKKLNDNWSKPKKGYFNFDVIGQYFTNNKKKDVFHIISDRTKNDIDVDELFKFIDRTSSKIGQQYLYNKIRVIQNVEKNNIFNKLVKLFEENNDLRLKCQITLSSLNSDDAYDLEKLIHRPILKPKYTKFLIPLSVLSITSIIIGLFYPPFLILLIPVYSINLVLHFKNKQSINHLISAVNQLSIALKVGKKLSSISKIKNKFSDILFIKEVNKIELKTKFISFQEHLTNDLVVVIWYIIELIKIIFNIEAIIFYMFIDDVTEKNSSINELFQFIGIIDAAISTASVKSGNKTCEPVFNKKNKIEITEIAHPIIKNCIKNSIKLKGKSLLLTGSNMSGKTTFIRTVAVNTILAQTLNFAFAKKFTIPFFKIYSSIRISDDLLNDTSYYLKEVLIIKELIKASEKKEPCFFILDEIFKGTNTIERISGGKAILSYLNRDNHFVFVSTHDIELTDLLKNENFDLYHFSEKVENNKLFFDHQLKSGKLKTRNAIKILELYNYPDEVIKDAREVEKKTMANK